MSQFLRNEDGQAVVEYILAISLAVTVVSIFAITFRRAILRVWSFMTHKIASPSPLVPGDGRYNL